MSRETSKKKKRRWSECHRGELGGLLALALVVAADRKLHDALRPAVPQRAGLARPQAELRADVEQRGDP